MSILPVRRGLPKFSVEASQSTPMVAATVGHGPRSVPKKLLPYPTVATAMATLAITSEMKYV